MQSPDLSVLKKVVMYNPDTVDFQLLTQLLTADGYSQNEIRNLFARH